ncbi:MAG: hypothetical protein ACK4F7_00440 [Inhella sp.]
MHLRDYLKAAGISQAAFGQKLDPPVSQGKVSHWLEGRRRVSLVEGLQVAKLTDGQVSMEDLAAMYLPSRSGPHNELRAA